MPANEHQVGGSHYMGKKIQHWDLAAEQEYDYFQGQITKYVDRWKRKNGIEDLKKAQHFLEKYIEEVEKGKFLPMQQIYIKPGDVNINYKPGDVNYPDFISEWR